MKIRGITGDGSFFGGLERVVAIETDDLSVAYERDESGRYYVNMKSKASFTFKPDQDAEQAFRFAAGLDVSAKKEPEPEPEDESDEPSEEDRIAEPPWKTHPTAWAWEIRRGDLRARVKFVSAYGADFMWAILRCSAEHPDFAELMPSQYEELVAGDTILDKDGTKARAAAAGALAALTA